MSVCLLQSQGLIWRQCRCTHQNEAVNTLKASMLWVWNCDPVGVPLFSWLSSSNIAKKEPAVGRQYRWERYEDEEKQFRDELFFTSYVELAPLTRHQLVVETWFELQPDCFCDQAVCHYNSAISPTEHFSTFLNTTPRIDHNCHFPQFTLSSKASTEPVEGCPVMHRAIPSGFSFTLMLDRSDDSKDVIVVTEGVKEVEKPHTEASPAQPCVEIYLHCIFPLHMTIMVNLRCCV